MAQAYVDDSVMTEWKNNMESINANCIEAIEGMETCLNNLNDSFRGDYASEYGESYENFIKNVKNSHEELRDVEAFLDSIVNVMHNQ